MDKREAGHTELRIKTMKCAMKMFAQNGIRSVRMDDIASELGISKRTLYIMFEDKKSLLIQGLKHEINQQEIRYRKMEAEEHNPLILLMKIHAQKMEDIKGVSGKFIDDMMRYKNDMKFFDDVKKERDEKAIRFFQKCAEQKLFRKDINYELAIRLYNYVEEGIMRDSLYKEYSFYEIADSFVLIHIRGLCTPMGLDIIDRYVK